jgi:hypothetical protein
VAGQVKQKIIKYQWKQTNISKINLQGDKRKRWNTTRSLETNTRENLWKGRKNKKQLCKVTICIWKWSWVMMMITTAMTMIIMTTKCYYKQVIYYLPLSCVFSIANILRARSCRKRFALRGIGECCSKARNSRSICNAASWNVSILQHN